MGIANEKTIARREKAEIELDHISRRDGAIGDESQNAGNQQKRDDRAHSSESSVFDTGTRVTGGMLDHLIDEYSDQVAFKKEEIQRLNEEVARLNSRIHEFKSLREDLRKQSQETA